MKMGVLYGSTLAEVVTIGTALSIGLRAGLIQSERTPTKNGEKASPSAWLTRILDEMNNNLAECSKSFVKFLNIMS